MTKYIQPAQHRVASHHVTTVVSDTREPGLLRLLREIGESTLFQTGPIRK